METTAAPNVVEITKRCTKCGELKPYSAFKKNPRQKSNGRRPTCRSCDGAALKAWRVANKGKAKEQYDRARAIRRVKALHQFTEMDLPTSRQCSICGIERPISNYSVDAGGPFLRSRRCRACEKSQGAAWRSANRPAIKEKHKRNIRSFDPAAAKLLRDAHPTMVQKCSLCKKEKPFPDFCLSRSRKIGLSSVCRPCTKIKSEEWRKKYPERFTSVVRRRNRLKKYGLTDAAFKALLSSQGSKCAVCRDEISEGSFRCHVDHDHDTGAVRGILCNKCNAGIGMLQESADVVRAALEYLLRASGKI